MRSFWHPLSTVLLSEPRCYATAGLVRMLLGSEAAVRMIYAGDRMWPAVEHGTSFHVEPARDEDLAPGTVVLALRNGIPDLLRIASVEGQRLTLAADSDPRGGATVIPEAVLGRARLPVLPPPSRRAALRRVRLDLREAWRHRPDPDDDPAQTVRDKYESQAAFYARPAAADIDPRLLARIRDRAPAGSRALVVGSGAGRESFALAESGFSVVGVEFSPTMAELSLEEAARRGLDADFRRADIREYAAAPRSLGAIFFTYDVYSFIPRRGHRVDLLRRMRSWLRPDGVVFLSARRVRSAYDRLILTLQWVSQQRTSDAEWGDTHTRWIPNDGRMRRSYIHVFSAAQLAAETAQAGFLIEPWQGGHAVLEPHPAAIIPG